MCAPDLEAIEVDVSPTASVADNENIKSSESVGLIEDYAYYPRGRVLYREKDGRFIVYADRCLMAKEDKETILRLFGHRSAVWRKDEQYQCAGCNEELREDAETCEALKKE